MSVINVAVGPEASLPGRGVVVPLGEGPLDIAHELGEAEETLAEVLPALLVPTI